MREKITFEPGYGNRSAQSIIKVIGVGGGGGNAVKHMYKDGIVGVDFLVCNTDRNALEANPVPHKLILGDTGLGAGANPEKAREYAINCRDEIKDFIGTETRMLFITAGMGKGTGTGAAPVVAEIAKEMGILTIAVVTLPFKFEGPKSLQYADAGIAEMKKHVDSLIIIKNQNIFKFYNDEELDKAFGYADDVLKNAVKCIAELITINLQQNIDFNDVRSIMKDSGAAMLGIAEAKGENRIEEVLENVLRCPLLTEEHISNAHNFLFSISYGSEKKLLISELEKLTDKFEELKSKNSHVIWGRSEDVSLGDKIKLSVIISKYDTCMREYSDESNEIVPFDGEKMNDLQVIDHGTSIFSDTNPEKFRSQLIETPNVNSVFDDLELLNPTSKAQNDPQYSNNKEQNIFEFLDQSQKQEKKHVILEPIIIDTKGEKISMLGPQKISSSYNIAYEDDIQFHSLVDTPAIQRIRQDNHSDFQDMALQNNAPTAFAVEDDMHEFFKNLPD